MTEEKNSKNDLGNEEANDLIREFQMEQAKRKRKGIIHSLSCILYGSALTIGGYILYDHLFPPEPPWYTKVAVKLCSLWPW
jgi:hypothetical protein